MDAATLDGLAGELRSRLVGQHLGRARAAAAHALAIELGRGGRLWWDAGRETAGAYLLPREQARALADEDAASGRTRHALLLARKHLEGARVSRLERVAGSRTLVLEAGTALFLLRLGGAAPAATLAVDGVPLATLGEGSPAWPPPEPGPDREWQRLDPARFAAEVTEAQARGWSGVRAHLAACPGLGPQLARLIASGALSYGEVRERLGAPAPTLVAPAPLDCCDDADLAARDAVLLLPFAPPLAAGSLVQPGTWTEAAAAWLAARLRGRRFDAQRKALLEDARRRIRRLRQLEARLMEDRRTLPAPDGLRRQAEALLAGAAVARPAAADQVEVPDPYDPERALRVTIDRSASLPVNANRLFDKARRVDRAGRHLDERLAATGAALLRARSDETAALAARNASDLAPAAAAPEGRARAAPRRGVDRYLTARGLEIVAGRGAQENQRVTFEVAGPEDWWLHARDVPGAHVVLRDPEGRATVDDLREAAETAAFLSDARAEGQADVHATRRKHVRPAGGAGRVRVLHSETLRVTPRDPEGRLRRR